VRGAGRGLRQRVQAVVAPEWSGGPEALLDEYQPVRLQDRAGLLLQGGQRGVVGEQLLGLRRTLSLY
jgi:hypothetical protein